MTPHALLRRIQALDLTHPHWREHPDLYPCAGAVSAWLCAQGELPDDVEEALADWSILCGVSEEVMAGAARKLLRAACRWLSEREEVAR